MEKLLGFINEFGKLARLKINMQEYVVFLYTNSILSENKPLIENITY